MEMRWKMRIDYHFFFIIFTSSENLAERIRKVYLNDFLFLILTSFHGRSLEDTDKVCLRHSDGQAFDWSKGKCRIISRF
jgi:hypothetical protein